MGSFVSAWVGHTLSCATSYRRGGGGGGGGGVRFRRCTLKAAACSCQEATHTHTRTHAHISTYAYTQAYIEFTGRISTINSTIHRSRQNTARQCVKLCSHLARVRVKPRVCAYFCWLLGRHAYGNTEMEIPTCWNFHRKNSVEIYFR